MRKCVVRALILYYIIAGWRGAESYVSERVDLLWVRQLSKRYPGYSQCSSTSAQSLALESFCRPLLWRLMESGVPGPQCYCGNCRSAS